MNHEKKPALRALYNCIHNIPRGVKYIYIYTHVHRSLSHARLVCHRSNNYQ